MRPAVLLSILLVLPTVAAQVPYPALPNPSDVLDPPPPQEDCDVDGDAPSYETGAFRISAPVDCAGVMTQRDYQDTYVFFVHAGQWVDVRFDPDPQYPNMWGSVRGPLGEGGWIDVPSHGHWVSFLATTSGDVIVQVSWDSSRDMDFDYRIRAYASGETPDDPQNDCGTGAGASNAYSAATPVAVPLSCTGTLRGADAWDWYSFPVRLGQDIDVRLDVGWADHEVCLYGPNGGGAVACSTRPWAQDETISWTNASERGDWRVVVFRYDGDGDYGLSVDVHGEPDNEAPWAFSSCPDFVDANETFTCTIRAEDFDSAGVRFTVRWSGGDVEHYPPEGYHPVGEPLAITHQYALPGGYEWISVRATDEEGATSWSTGGSILVRGHDPVQDDCGTGVEAGDTFANATLILAPRVLCVGQFHVDEWADLQDWYAVDVQPNDTLRIRLEDVSYGVACLYTPEGEQDRCIDAWDEELAVPINATGTWRVRVSTWWDDDTYGLSVSTRETTAVTAPLLPSLSPAPSLTRATGLDGLDGDVLDLPASTTGERGMRVVTNGGYRAQFLDEAGEVVLEATGYGYDDDPWTPIPIEATRVLVETRSLFYPEETMAVTVFH